MSKKEKQIIKTDPKCKRYIHNHCMNTIDQKNHTSVARECNTASYFCDRKKREKKK